MSWNPVHVVFFSEIIPLKPNLDQKFKISSQIFGTV